ncbi:hypothetical protein JWG42_14250 [Desulfoprunum benzoelyticum]|nr:hypothetical protein [Desulfoprunum benzoelyticum]
MCFCGILLENVCIASELPEWKIAEQTILQCYKGRDIEVSVSTGYEHRIYQDGPVDGEFATAMLTVPIYSRKQILEKQNLAHEKIEHLSELYADYQSQSAIVYALDKEKEVLQNTMIDEGAKGISAYYELIKDVEKAKSLRDSAERKIITWLELCGYVATDKTPGKGSPSQ